MFPCQVDIAKNGFYGHESYFLQSLFQNISSKHNRGYGHIMYGTVEKFETAYGPVVTIYEQR